MSSLKGTIITGVVIFSLAIFGGLWIVGTGIEARNVRGITVTGSAQIPATADVVVWNIYLNAQLPTIPEAVNKVEDDKKAIIEYLKQKGIAESEISAGGISTFRVVEYVDGNQTNNVLGYEASSNIRVRSVEIQNVINANQDIAQVLQTGINAGVNAPEFYLSNLQELRPDVIQAAVEDAKVRAEAMVAGVGGTIGEPISASTGSVEVNPPDVLEGGYGSYDTSTVEKSVRAVVSVTFGIE